MKTTDWMFESHLGLNRSWFHYYVQYRKVVRDLVDSIQMGVNPTDTIALPLLFLIRHCLELGLKANILEFEKVNPEIQKIKFSGRAAHSLEVLHAKFIEHLKAYQNKYSLSSEIESQMNSYLKKLVLFKTNLHELDNGSFNFRYPVDTTGKFNFKRTEKKNIKEIVKAFNEVDPFLVSTVDVLL